MWVAVLKGVRRILLCGGVVALSCLPHVSAHAIDVRPTAEQIQAALELGKEAAQKKSPATMPIRLWLIPKVFL